MVRLNKKGISGFLIKGIFYLIVFIAVGAVIYDPIVKPILQTMGFVDEELNTTKYDATKILSTEAEIVKDSMEGLVTALNAVASGQDVNDYKIDFDPHELKFDYYDITFSAQIEIEEDGVNEVRDWAFTERFNVDKESKAIAGIKEQYISADYTKSCTSGNNNRRIDCGKGLGDECVCTDQTGPGNGLDDTAAWYGEMDDADVRKDLVKEAAAAGIAPIRDMNTVYNIALTTYDKDGNPICKVSTKDGKWFTDTKAKDLLVWGATSVESCPNNKDFEKGDGCDRNGNGVQGAYGPKFANNAGKVPEGEGCSDSPTWVECDGIRVYYCGKLGLSSGAGGKDTQYYFFRDATSEIHSRAGIKVLTKFSKREGEATSANRANKPNKVIVKKGESGREEYDMGSNYAAYAQEYDLDVAGTFLAAGVIGGAAALSVREIDDPNVYCYDGRPVGSGNTKVKCDGRFGCAVCNFNLPQEKIKDHNAAVEWFAGYGDPRYVVYYEEFPAGEDEAWHVDPLDVSFGTLAAWNIGSAVGVGIVKKGAKLTASIARALGTVGKATTAGTFMRVVKFLGKPITWTAKKGSELVQYLARKTSEAVGLVVKKGAKEVSSPELAIKLFSDTSSVIRYVDPNDLKQVAGSLDEVAEWVVEKNSKQLDVLTEALHKSGKVPSAIKVYEQTLMNPANPVFWKIAGKKGIKYGAAYAFALSMAKQDSMNQKFNAVGINTIGWKQPYGKVFKTGFDGMPALDDEVSNYYIQLVKDQYKGSAASKLLLDQASTRFFLASPCQADLVIVRDKCLCWDSPEESVIPREKAGQKYGHVPVKKSSLDDEYGATDPRRYEYGVRACRDRTAGWEDFKLGVGEIVTGVDWEDTAMKYECISVNPVLKGDTFCYSGSHTLADVAKIGTAASAMAASIALEVAADSVAIVTAPTVAVPALAVGMKIGANYGIDVVAALVENAITEQTKWPNH